MRIEGLYASCSPSFEPLTDRPFTHTQRYRDILLLPTRLFQLPRSFASFFSPIGFLWCSHTSYLSTLYFPLPRSVIQSTPISWSWPLFFSKLLSQSTSMHLMYLMHSYGSKSRCQFKRRVMEHPSEALG